MRKVGKRRKGTKADRKRYWASRYAAFIKSGFCVEAARWGANAGISLKSTQTQRLMSLQKFKVNWMMEHYEISRPEAIKKAGQELRYHLDQLGIREWNFFKEGSPEPS